MRRRGRSGPREQIAPWRRPEAADAAFLYLVDDRSHAGRECVSGRYTGGNPEAAGPPAGESGGREQAAEAPAGEPTESEAARHLHQ